MTEMRQGVVQGGVNCLVTTLTSLHDRIPSGVMADMKVLSCRGNDWIRARRGSFSNILPHLRNRARKIPVRNRVSLCT